MPTVKRFDTHKIGKNVIETAQGFLMIPAFTARTGIQTYRDEKGKILKEFRPESEVFSESSMSSLRTAVVTDGHPKEMVNPDNVKDLAVGFPNGVVTKETIKDEKEKFLGTHLIITHRDAIEAIRAGKAELSNGYKVDLEFAAGKHNGEHFDAVQRNIVNNHIAIVWKGRAGKNASLKLDEQDAILINQPKEKTMKITVNGKEFDVADELGKEIETERTNLDAGNKAEMKKKEGELDDEKKKSKDNLKAFEEKKEKVEAKNDALEADIKKLKAEKTDSVDINKEVKERISIMAIGNKMLDGETVKKIDSMSNEEIKVAVIKVDSPEVDEEKLKKDSYVDARFDHISENLDASASETKKVGAKIVKKREDGNQDPEYKTPEQVRTDNQAKVIENSNKQIGRRANT